MIVTNLHIACVCGGWIEATLAIGIFSFLYKAIKWCCHKIGCLCKCHGENEKDYNIRM